MLKRRIIATLLFNSNGQVIKRSEFCGSWRLCGPLLQHVKVMNSRDIDELVLIDATATQENRPPNYELIDKCTLECYMPVTIGGGMNSFEIAKHLINNVGADKILIKTEINNKKLLRDISSKFGEQSIVAALDFKGKESLTHENLDIINNLPVGEILLTSMFKDGKQSGYDTELIDYITSNVVGVPLIANGGCGHPGDMIKAFDAGADAVASGSMFLFSQWTPRKCAGYIATHSKYEVRQI